MNYELPPFIGIPSHHTNLSLTMPHFSLAFDIME